MKPKIYLLLAYAVFIFISGRFMFDGFGETWNKVSADDHYSWILKAPQLTDCFNEDCRFIKDTKSQLYMNFDVFPEDVNFIRWREQHCLFDIYTPLYSAQLILYKTVFKLPNWESAYQWVAITGYVVSTLGVLFFLVTAFGYYPAALAFLFMSLSQWGWLQFGIITPSFFVTGIMFSLMALFMRRPVLLLRILPVVIIATSLYHPMGKMYSFVLLILTGMYFFEKIIKGGKILFVWALSLLSFAAMLALGFVEKPQFKLINFPFHNNAELLQHFKLNVLQLLKTMSDFLYFGDFSVIVTGLLNIAAVCVLFYLLKKIKQRRDLTILSGFMFFLLMLASAFHFFKNYPGNLTARLMIPFFVFLCGSMGSLLFHLISVKSEELKTKVLSLFFVVLFLIALFVHFERPDSIFSVPKNLLFETANDNLFEPKQVAKIFDENGNCGSILYLDQTPMWVYSMYGALKCGAVVAYVWPDTSSQRVELIRSRDDITHAVIFNPLYSHLNRPIIHSEKGLVIHFKDPSAVNFNIILKANDYHSKLVLTHVDSNKKVLDSVTAVFEPESRQTFSYPIAGDDMIQIIAEEGEALLEKASYSETMNWPWNDKVIFRFINIDENGKAVNSAALDLLTWRANLSSYYKVQLEPIDDSKSTVLMKVLSK